MFDYGRINRTTYWVGIGLMSAIYAAFALISKKHISVAEVALIFMAVPRLHDIGKSGWWAGAIFLGEILVVVIALLTLGTRYFTIPAGLYVLLVAGLMIWLGCVRGDAAANRFGEPPAPGMSWLFGRIKTVPTPKPD